MNGDFTSGLDTAVTVFTIFIFTVGIGVGVGVAYLFNWLF